MEGILERLLSTASVFSLKQESRSQLESDARDGVVGGFEDWEGERACKVGLAGSGSMPPWCKGPEGDRRASGLCTKVVFGFA